MSRNDSIPPEEKAEQHAIPDEDELNGDTEGHRLPEGKPGEAVGPEDLARPKPGPDEAEKPGPENRSSGW